MGTSIGDRVGLTLNETTRGTNGGEEEASSRLGTADAGLDLEPDAQPAQAGHRRVGRRVDVPAAAARANLSTPPPGGPAAPWR